MPQIINRIVYQEDFASFKCACQDQRHQGECSNSNEMLIVQCCHPQAPTATFVDRANGTVKVCCSECEQEIVTFKVASRPKPNPFLNAEKAIRAVFDEEIPGTSR